ncbi:hypothetical protein OIE67_23200 [Nonomuraea fuscirosea]|uniref:hypothetical protein n=1 Tax=Nonomuraea fuscirosea TaxID=1291556 RepID=UPI002DDA22F3|nr:hypothetical protein [Nonomuraea fuscirosea]WSA57415.1 hypothetical protein OIE67_23200 [Nonomuraea fuscirosea]
MSARRPAARLADVWPRLPGLAGPEWLTLRPRLLAAVDDDGPAGLPGLLAAHPAIADLLATTNAFTDAAEWQHLHGLDGRFEQVIGAVVSALDGHADERKVVDTVLAAGVAAALGEGAEVFTREELFAPRPSAFGGSVPPLLSWSDPLPWLRELPDDVAWAADAWQIAVTWQPGVRLAVRQDERDAELVALLASGTGVVSVVHEAQVAEPREIPRWSWPLRLTVPDDPVATETVRELRAAITDRAELVTSTTASGRWNRTSLLLLTGEPWTRPLMSEDREQPVTGEQGERLLTGEQRGQPLFGDDQERLLSGEERARPLVGEVSSPVRATAVVALTGAPWSPQDLRELGRRHRAAVAAALDPGPRPRQWLEALLALLSQDAPLDVALHQAAGACDAPAPLVVADPRYLDSTRIRPLLAAAPYETLSRDDASRVRRALRGGPGGDAGTVVHGTAAELRAAAHRGRRLSARHLRADVVEHDGETPAERITPDSPFHVRVRIAAGQARPDEQPFPSDALPPGPVHRLTVLATDLAPPPGGERVVRHAEIDLPAEGSSGTAVLTFQAGPPGAAVEIAIMVLHRSRFLQTGVLSGRAGAAEPPEFRADAVVRASLDDLDLARAHDAALSHGTDSAGTETVTTQAGAYVQVHEPLNPTETVETLLSGLRLLVTDAYQPAGYQDERFAELLIRLARLGRRLRKNLFPEREWNTSGTIQALRAARSVSVFSARPGAFLPLELVYDRPVDSGPGRSLSLCPHAPALLERPGCAGCPERERPGVVCPFGFWGASKVIERHVRSDLADARYAVGISPDVDRHACALDPICAAASDRADHNDAAAWSAAAASLERELPGAVRFASSWESLDELVRDARAGGAATAMVLLVPHSEVDGDGIGVLSLGDEDKVEITDGLEFLFAGDGGPEPVVLVLGCTTAGGPTLFSDTAALLLHDGAPGVIATLVPVLGRHIVPVGVHLVRELRLAAARPGGSSLGEALLRARRRLLTSGDACVLALAGFGDTDWELRRPS